MKLKFLVSLLVLVQITICLCRSIDEKKAYFRSLPGVNFSLADATNTDVKYTLFTTSSPTDGVLVTDETCDAVIKDKTSPTVLIIHGWTTDDNSPWFRPLRDEYFKQGPHNVIFIDWNKAGNKSYSVSSANIKPVGKFIATFLVNSKVDLDKVHLVGHSLGSHLASYIGKSIENITGKKIGRITGLDPAGPMFSRNLETERLCENDANFVDVIHTDIQLSGVTEPIGHVDFYPNEGKHQPGCPSTDKDYNCSHARSTLFFIESVATKAISKEATFNEDEHFTVTVIPKKNGKEIIFGQHVDQTARGVYYFKTNPAKPFLS